MNFQVLIKSLIEDGWTQTRIAEEVGCSQATIARLFKDSMAEPGYRTGAAIVDLFELESGCIASEL